MPPVLLDNITHRDLRILTTHGPALGDDVMTSPVFPTEFRSVQAHYPIVFQQGADGALQPVALLGLRQGENLFLDEGAGRWDAHYVPLALARQPFLIGRAGEELVIHVDTSHPRVRGLAGHDDMADGVPLFLPHGGASEYLEHANSVLLALHEGLESLPAFTAALLRHELLESFVMDVELSDGSQSRLAGFLTIHEERLAALGADALHDLHRAGHLAAVYLVVASLAHLRDLVERLNARLAAGG